MKSLQFYNPKCCIIEQTYFDLTIFLVPISSDLFDFKCPKVDEGIAATHPRYADPEDCQLFYVCVNGEEPRRNGCKLGQAFDEVSKRCDWARKIPEW